MSALAAVILAAGRSSRMEGERPKVLLPFGERTIVEAVVGVAEAAGLSPVVVVTGYRGGEVRDALAGTPARVAHNPRWAEGQATSLARGIRAVRTETDAEAALVLLGDEPTLRPEAVRRVVDAWREGAGPVVRAVYPGRPGHPVLIAREAFPELEDVSGDHARRHLCARTSDVEKVVLDFPAPRDVDTVDDYRAVAEKGSAG